MSDSLSPKQNTNLSDIARALGVSSATVSNALSGKGRVSPSLIARVKEMADRLGYVPSQAGRALRTGRNGVLGLVLPDIANPLFPQIAQAVEAAAVDAGYGVLIGDSRGAVDLQTAAINRLIERGVDGLVIVPRRGTRIADMDIPVAVIDSPSTPGNTVAADHWQGGELVGAHLAALGHHKVLLLGKNPASIVQSDRIGGIKSGLMNGLSGEQVKSAGIEVLWIEHHEDIYGSGALLGLKEKIAQGITAIATVSDVHALRAMTELYHGGYKVPSDVSVVGFDDLFWSSGITPALSTVRMDLARIGQIAIASLIQVIEGHAQSNKGIVPSSDISRVPMNLIIRQTCGAFHSNSSLHSAKGTPPC
ncbi:LacI family DNA-binding transcriptional regulator [Brucellaceae bacterium C25G]